MLQLRVKHKGGQSVITALTEEDKVADLLAQLSTQTHIPEYRIKILKGFPPLPVDVSNVQMLLRDSGLQHRDTLLVEELPIPAPVASDARVKTVEVKPEESLPVGQLERTGILLRKVVPADNSCLFTSIGYCLSGKQDSSKFMRELVASTVKNQSEQYNEAFLGKPNKEYQKWILQVHITNVCI